jgi:hypothetical protein
MKRTVALVGAAGVVAALGLGACSGGADPVSIVGLGPGPGENPGPAGTSPTPTGTHTLPTTTTTYTTWTSTTTTTTTSSDCWTCYDFVAQGLPNPVPPICTGSESLLSSLGVCACSGGCSSSCDDFCLNSMPVAGTCLSCLSTTCSSEWVACESDY